MTHFWLIPALAFLLGSIPCGYLLYRWRRGADIRQEGSGNIGATNVMRRAGAGLGLATLACDAAKGALALVLADFLGYQTIPRHYVFLRTTAPLPIYHYDWIALAIVAAMVGHMYTPWLHGRGGKGVATGLGLFLALAPRALGLGVLIFAAVVAIWRFISLASIVTAVAMPGLVWLTYGRAYPPGIYLATAICAGLIVWRHRENLRRLRAGGEYRFAWKNTTRTAAP